MKLISVIILALLSACGSQEKLTDTIVSPDGSMTARLYVTDLGACCSPHGRVSLNYMNSESEEVTEEVYTSAGGWPYEIKWLDDWNLLVVACDAHQTKMRSSIFTENFVVNDYRRLHILSAHARDIEIDGTKYCKFPD